MTFSQCQIQKNTLYITCNSKIQLCQILSQRWLLQKIIKAIEDQLRVCWLSEKKKKLYLPLVLGTKSVGWERKKVLGILFLLFYHWKDIYKNSEYYEPPSPAVRICSCELFKQLCLAYVLQKSYINKLFFLLKHSFGVFIFS